jgi:phenylacetic acid degradation operon negative regulatory protein
LGGGTARSALFTVLSACVYRDPEPGPTRAFIYVLGLCGIEDKAARQAVNRAAASGWIEASRHGREALWTVARAGRELLDEGSLRVADLSERHRQWDGEVALVSVSVPETNRTLRHQLKTRMAFAGFASTSPGLWISTRRSADKAAADIITDLGLTNSNSFVARAGALGDLGALVRQAWQIEELGERYRAFVDEFGSSEPTAGDETLLTFVKLLHQRRRFVLLDPVLPGALLPPSWAGDQADEMWTKCYGKWRRPAAQRWSEIRDGQD